MSAMLKLDTLLLILVTTPKRSLGTGGSRLDARYMIEVFPDALLCLPHGDMMEVVMKLSTALRGDGHQSLSVTTVDDLPTSSFDLSSGLLATAWLEMGHPASDLPNGSLVVAELSSDVGIDLLSTMVS